MKKRFLFYILTLACGHVHAQTISFKPVSPWKIVQVRALDKAGVTGVPGVRAYCSAPGENFVIGSAVSDSLGRLIFYMKDANAAGVYIFQADPADVAKTSLKVEEPMTTLLSAGMAEQDSLPFYGKPDFAYLLDDYTRFTSMEEVLIEYVREVRLRKRKEKFSLEVLNTPYAAYFEQPPFILLDGVPVFDINRLMSLDPLRIRKLEVVARKYYYGSLVCHGILSFTSYTGDLAGYKLPPEALVAELK